MRKVNSIFLLLLFSSCGLKITNEIDDNVLLGSWKLDRIFCYPTNNTVEYKEDYDVGAQTDFSVTLDFIGSKIQYMASVSNTDPTLRCSTSATAKYSADFNGTSTGLVDIFEVVLGTTDTCDVSFTFRDSVGTSTADTVGDIKLTMNSNFSKDLTWSVSEDRNTLTLSMFTGFNGSSKTAYCGGSCKCSGVYERN